MDVDLTDVALVRIEQQDKGSKDIGLGARVGLHGMTAAGTGAAKDPKLVALAEVIDRLNELFGETLSPAQKQSFVETQLATMLENRKLVAQAAANSAGQFMESPDLKDEVLDTVAGNQEATRTMTDFFFDSAGVDVLIGLLGKAFYEYAQQSVAS